MKFTKIRLGFLLIICLLSFAVQAGTTYLSLSPDDWIEYGTVTSSRSKENYAGYMRFKCNTYRGAIAYRSVETFNLKGGTVRYKWKMSSASNNYCWSTNGITTANGFGRYFNIHHVWDKGILVTSDRWVYTELIFNENMTYSWNYSYTGYGLGGIFAGSSTLSEAGYNTLEAASVVIRGGDNYTMPMILDIGDVHVITAVYPLTVDINVPAVESYHEPNDVVSFKAIVTGGEEPYTYQWTSDIDGILSDTNSFDTSLLSLGRHYIAIRCEDANSDSATDGVYVNIIEPPVIQEIPDVTIADGSPYYANIPVVNKSAGTVTWTKTAGHLDMVLNSSNGQISWLEPVASDTPCTVTIMAENPVGDDTESWQVTVVAKPEIAIIFDDTILEGQTYTGPTPIINKGDNITWSLNKAPAGTTIDPATGVITWSNAAASFTPYEIIIRATNSVGYDTQNWHVTVESAPVINPIINAAVEVGDVFSYTPVLSKGLPAATWSKEAGPAGLSVNPSTGQMTWSETSVAGNYDATIKAENIHGSDLESFEIKVQTIPEIADIADQLVNQGTAFSLASVLTKGTGVVWSLIAPPAGIVINPETGQIIWNNVTGNYSPYTITVKAQNFAGSDQKSFVLTVAKPPIITNIDNDIVADGEVYTGPVPSLYQGNAPITWSIENAPVGSSIDPATGVITLPSVSYNGSNIELSVKAENSIGFDTEQWEVEIVRAPVISTFGDKTIVSSQSYTSAAPTLSQGTNITWSLITAPADVEISPSIGQISWANPIAAATAYEITLKAENIAGSDQSTWFLMVLDKPMIAAISNDSANEWQSYTSVFPSLLQGASPITWSLVRGPAGMTINAESGAVNWLKPAASVSPYEVKIKAQNQVGFDEKSWMIEVSAGYAAQVSTDVDVQLSGSPVPFTGNAIWLGSGTPAANVPVKIAVKLKGMTRILNATTDAVGDINTVFTPLSGEAGLYTISASHPIAGTPAPQDQFKLVAMKADPQVYSHTIYEGNTAKGSFNLKNLGDTSLSGIAYQINGPNNIDLHLGLSPNMNGMETQIIDYNLTALNASVTDALINVAFTSSEGAQAIYTINAKVKPLLPQLNVNPTSLRAGMVRGQRTNVQFEIANTGGAATPELTVLIPNASWIDMANPEVIGTIDANSTKLITLQLSPQIDAPLGSYKGSVMVYGEGMSKTIPFDFTCVSNAVGGLDISATDEYTYYGVGFPNVDNAILSLKDLVTGQIHYNNEPIPGGRLLLENLPESYYELEVRAPEHDIYKATVVVVPGINSPIQTFMSRQLVTYIWTVVPTLIEDLYTVTLTQTYKTNVPAPVIVIEPSNVDISNMIGGEKQVDFAITNYGLVAAEDFHLVFDEHSQIEVELLVDFNGRIDPNTTIIIPAIIRDTQYVETTTFDGLERTAMTATTSSACDPATGGGYYTLVCGDDRKWHKKPITIANWLCELGSLLPSIPNIGGYESDDGSDDNLTDEPRQVTPGGSALGGGGTLALGSGGSTIRGNSSSKPNMPTIIITLPHLGGGGDSSGGCDPCPRKQLEAIVNCGLSFIPSCPFQIILNGYNCIEACYSQGLLSQNCYIICGHGLISSITGCVEDAAGTLTGFGIVWNILGCLYGVTTACQDLDAVMYQQYATELNNLTDGELNLPSSLPDSADALADLLKQLDRLSIIMEATTDLFGDPAWFSCNQEEAIQYKAIMNAYVDAIDPAGDMGGRISSNERAQLLLVKAPSAITSDVINYTCDRWNRTLDYWDAGKFTAGDLDSTDNPDFIDSVDYFEKWTAANDTVLQMQAEGFDTLLGPVENAVDNLHIALAGNDEGVCAKVKIEIDQRVVISRSAFKATLTMTNDSQFDTLEGITVNVEITDLFGNPANISFGIYPPEVTGISDLKGNGDLLPGQNMEALWLIVPTNEAAPLVSTDYLVGGEISYTINGSQINIPLSPDIITVKPDPRLSVKYFFETDVYSDDPFTPEIEPAVPFALGLMVINKGAGTAYDFSITSALPEIVRHEQDKDIIISFDLIGTIIGNQPVKPALALNIGDIEPNDTKVAQWLMTTTIQGEFIKYDAIFAHLDPLGDPRLSLIDSLASHELIHVVQADCPDDDGVSDFLVNDVPDINGVADTVHLSDGSVEAVEAMIGSSSWITGTLSDTALSVTLATSHTPSGFVYIRVPDPGYGIYELVSVIRSDGKIIKVAQNAWTTHKTVREIGQEPYDKNYLHIFDCDGSGQYTLTFVRVGDAVPVVHNVNITDITSDIGSQKFFNVTYADNNAVDITTLDSSDIRVMGPYGFDRLADFVSADLNSNGSPITATYGITAPGGLWDSADNGFYQLYMERNQVADNAGNFVLPGVIAGFITNFPAECNNLEVISYNLLEQRRVSRTVFDYDYSVTLRNNCMNPVSNFRFVPVSIPSEMTLLYDNIIFDCIGPFETGTGTGLFTVRMDSLVVHNIVDLKWQAEILTTADFSQNGTVSLEDLLILCQHWLTENSDYDIAPPEKDGFINFLDFAEFASQWMPD